MNRTRSNRRILLLCTLLVCLVSMLMIRFSAAAEENVIPETRQLPRLVDRADLLSELEEEELEAVISEDFLAGDGVGEDLVDAGHDFISFAFVFMVFFHDALLR